MNKLRCGLCGFVTKSCSQLTGHLRHTHGLWKKDQEWYYMKYIQYPSRDVYSGFCKWCGLPTKFHRISDGFQLFCDHTCRANYESTIRNPLDKPGARKRLSEAHKRIAHLHASLVRGNKNPMKRHDIAMKVQATMEKNGHPTRGKTYEQIYGVEKAKKLRHLRSKHVNRPHIIEAIRKKMLNGGAAYLNSFIKNPSKPQKKLYKICKQIFPDSVLNLSCLNFSLDIAIPSINVAIEYDGSYWHQDIDADLKRQQLIEEEGWIVLRYRDYVPSKNTLLDDIKTITGGDVRDAR